MGMRRTEKHQQADMARAWVYWGASGILQPLSEEFLYRSPAAVLSGSGNCRVCARLERRRGRD